MFIVRSIKACRGVIASDFDKFISKSSVGRHIRDCSLKRLDICKEEKMFSSSLVRFFVLYFHHSSIQNSGRLQLWGQRAAFLIIRDTLCYFQDKNG